MFLEDQALIVQMGMLGTESFIATLRKDHRERRRPVRHEHSRSRGVPSVRAAWPVHWERAKHEVVGAKLAKLAYARDVASVHALCIPCGLPPPA